MASFPTVNDVSILLGILPVCFITVNVIPSYKVSSKKGIKKQRPFPPLTFLLVFFYKSLTIGHKISVLEVLNYLLKLRFIQKFCYESKLKTDPHKPKIFNTNDGPSKNLRKNCVPQ